MNRYIHVYFTLMLILSGIFTSCITSKKVNYLQHASNRIPTYKDTVKYQETKLAIGDKIFIRVLSTDKKMNLLINGSTETTATGSENTDLYAYIIDDEGFITLPSIGKVSVIGKTIREAKKTLEEAFVPYFKDKFSLDIKMMDRYFSVIGGGTSGKFAITRDKINVFQALAMAGDINTYGDRSKIKIIRQINDSAQVITFDVRSKDILHSEFFYIQDNDVIYIQDVKEQFFSVTTFSSALSTIFSSISFGLFIYNLATPTPK